MSIEATPTIDSVTVATAGGNMWMTVGYCIIVLGIIYFMMVRPNQRRMAQYQKMLDALKIGDRVIAGGIYGTIKSISDKTIEVEIAKGVVITVAKNAVAAVE